MEIELTDLEGLPEGIRGAVTENKLDLSKLMVAEDLTGLKSALSKERANVAAWTKLGETPDAVLAQIEELRSAKPKGKADDEVAAMLSQVEEKYKGQLDNATKQLDNLRRESVLNAVKAELGKHGALPEALDVVANFANSRIMFADDGSLQIRTADGKPMVGTGENHNGTIADLAKDLASSMPFAFKDGGIGGGGKPPQSGGKPTQTQITRAEFKGLSPEAQMKHVQGGGTVID